MVVKIYFGIRAYRLSKGKLYAPCIIWAMSVAQFALGFNVRFSRLSTLIPSLFLSIFSVPLRMFQMTDLKNLGSASLGLGAATDIFTAMVLCYYLHTMRTGYRRSDSLINRLIMFSVNTGALTSACSLSVLIVYQLLPTNFVFISLYFILCKLYSNSCLATLNSRSMVNGYSTDRDESITFGSHRNNAFVLNPPRGIDNTPSDDSKKCVTSKTSHINIGICQETQITHDHDEVLTAPYSVTYSHVEAMPRQSISRAA
ncbi:hypothetical protein K488DRAFT_88895 [Vararia minispora EC-137]|uniref:Uncharacterized protein n=1 Tax=Vararia minispora EC-137 TaxID=1314806 RepID=A0ACB8QBP2_9AGAM|nr:hypothetical protein K488DRAFT_88895 [Vararia minispora EC-137]